MKIEREWAMANKNTFQITPIAKLLSQEITNGLWVDPFANTSKIATITNDINLEYDTDHHLDALDFLKMFDTSSVDGVLYDPPYSPRQVSECYGGFGKEVTSEETRRDWWAKHKKEITRILKIGGKVLCFGWNSGGVGKKNGFRLTRILLVPHGSMHNDTICTVEEKVREQIKLFEPI